MIMLMKVIINFIFSADDKNSFSTKFTEFFEGLKVIDPDSLPYIIW